MFNIGIIGLGGVGEVLLQAFQKHHQTKVLYVYDSNLDRLRDISKKYNVQSVADYSEILEQSTVDMVYLAVPPKYHHAIALDIIKSGKHIFCEKPLANSFEEAEEMVLEVEKRDLKNVMNFPTIYRPSFIKFKELLESNKIGVPLEIRLNATFEEWPRSWQKNSWISSREQGGFVKEVFPHYIQMILSLFNNLKIEESILTYPNDPALSEVAIVASGTVNSIPLSFEARIDKNQKEEIAFTITGSSGALTLQNWRELYFTTDENERVPINLETNDHLQKLISSIVAHLENKPSSVVTFQEGLQVQIVLEELTKNSL